MKQRNKYIAVSIYCLFMSILVVCGLIKNGSSYSGKSMVSSLLNVKYKNSIDHIELSCQATGDSLLIERKSSDGRTWWLASSAGMTYLADTSVVDNLLNAFSASRNLIMVTDRADEWDIFFLDDSNADRIVFAQTENGSLTRRSTLYFGSSTLNYSSIYVRNDKNPYVYKVQNELASYLEYDAAYWSDRTLFPEITETDASDIMNIDFIIYDQNGQISTRKIYNDGSSVFTDYVHTISILRGASVLPVEETAGSEKLYQISFSGTSSADGAYGVYSIYRLNGITEEGTESSRYFVRSGESNYYGTEGYVMEISSWTLSSITGIL